MIRQSRGFCLPHVIGKQKIQISVPYVFCFWGKILQIFRANLHLIGKPKYLSNTDDANHLIEKIYHNVWLLNK